MNSSGKHVRDTYVYKNCFWDFYSVQTKEVQSKIDWVIGLVRTLKIVPEKYFRHLESTKGLFELRVQVGSNIFRIFSFFDSSNTIILLNGFQKKSNKAHKREIEKAKQLRQKFYEDKTKS
jgi:phage-related protein